jgi:hypothetical protein
MRAARRSAAARPAAVKRPAPLVTRDVGIRRLVLAGPLLLILLLACTPGVGAREDLGRHLLLGRIITTELAVPHVNRLTYTHPDFPFVDHHWLSEVWLYALHHVVGLNGLIVWEAVTMTAALGIALLTVPPSAGLGAYWLAGILAAVILGYRADLRPELFTFVGVALYGWLFERLRRSDDRRLRLAVLLVGLLWANLHIYFIFGIGMAGAFLLERWWADRSRAARWREAAWFGALVLVSCIGPNGIAGLLYPFRIFANYGMAVSENRPPLELARTVLNPMLLALPLFSLATLGAILRLWWHLGSATTARLGAVVVALAGLVAAWTMARSVPLLALTGLPVIGAALSTLPRPRAPAARWAARAVLVAVALLNAWLIHGAIDGWYSRVFPAPIYPTPTGFEDETRYGRLRELAERHGLRGPVFTDYDVGSLVEYELFPEPGYVDNRPEAFPTAFWRTEYEPALELGAAWKRIQAERGFNAVIVSMAVGEEFIRALRRRPEWVLVLVDENGMVFVRNDPRNRAIIDALAYDPRRLDAYEADLAARIAALPGLPWWRRNVETERLVYRVYGLVCIDETARVWPHLERLHALYPDYQLVHELMRVAAPPAQQARVREVLRARAAWPVSANQVMAWANVLAAENRLDETRTVLRRGRLFFPLSNELREAVARLGN